MVLYGPHRRKRTLDPVTRSFAIRGGVAGAVLLLIIATVGPEASLWVLCGGIGALLLFPSLTGSGSKDDDDE